MFNQNVTPKPGEKGFTLVEMMIVISVLLVLIGTLIPIHSKFAARARVAKAASAANCLRAGLTGFSDWSAEKQTAVFNSLGSATGPAFFETSDRLGCSVGPTAENPRIDVALAGPRFCLIRIIRRKTIIEIGCVDFRADQLEPEDEVSDFRMGFDVPKVQNAQVELTSRAVTVAEDLQ